jgi:hypothetical protein
MSSFQTLLIQNMNNTKFSETVLLSLEAFWVLQELESLPPTSSAREFLNGVYSHRPVSYEDIRPLLRIGTCLCLLAPALAFASALADKSQLDELIIKGEYSIGYKLGGTSKVPGGKVVLRTIRNSLSHFTEPFADASSSCDEIKGRISFPDNVAVQFNNQNGSELIFDTREGFINFLNDLLPIVRSKLRPGIFEDCTRSE